MANRCRVTILILSVLLIRKHQTHEGIIYCTCKIFVH